MEFPPQVAVAQAKPHVEGAVETVRGISQQRDKLRLGGKRKREVMRSLLRGLRTLVWEPRNFEESRGVKEVEEDLANESSNLRVIFGPWRGLGVDCGF